MLKRLFAHIDISSIGMTTVSRLVAVGAVLLLWDSVLQGYALYAGGLNPVIVLSLLVSVPGTFILAAVSLRITNMTAQLSNALTGHRGAVERKAGYTETIRLIADEMQSTFQTQQTELFEATNSLEEISAVLSEAAKSATSTLEQSREMQDGAKKGLASLHRLREAMIEIEEANQHLEALRRVIDSIGDKLSVIDSIVLKTELISFNAQIEAARAGLSGRGFSVVATEIGVLAKSSGVAAGEIDRMITDSRTQSTTTVANIQRRVRSGKEASEECSSALSFIYRNVDDISPMIEMIKSTAEVQEKGLATTRAMFGELQVFDEKRKSNYQTLSQIIPHLIELDQRSAFKLNELYRILMARDLPSTDQPDDVVESVKETA